MSHTSGGRPQTIPTAWTFTDHIKLGKTILPEISSDCKNGVDSEGGRSGRIQKKVKCNARVGLREPAPTSSSEHSFNIVRAKEEFEALNLKLLSYVLVTRQPHSINIMNSSILFALVMLGGLGTTIYDNVDAIDSPRHGRRASVRWTRVAVTPALLGMLRFIEAMIARRLRSAYSRRHRDAVGVLRWRASVRWTALLSNPPSSACFGMPEELSYRWFCPHGAADVDIESFHGHGRPTPTICILSMTPRRHWRASTSNEYWPPLRNRDGAAPQVNSNEGKLSITVENAASTGWTAYGK
ncbi:hypothetical protein C8R43DRAFT_963512 [Mycena crocata]|nr:hypothetical protein C8R43DRAFT_963512 [Mycena crocata]